MSNRTSYNTSETRRFSPLAIAAAIAAVPVAIVVVLVLIAAMVAWDSTNAGEVAVVRNGGAFSNSNIRLVIQPASGLKWTGIWSNTHKYPATQRFYTITSDAKRGDRAGVDVVQTPSSDGVEMGIEGTLYFSLNLDAKTIRDFDNKFGTRSFTGADGKTHHAYDGDDGWSAFLDQIIRPVIDNDLRQQIGDFRCSELVSSCALVQNSANAVAPAANNNSNIAKIQDTINTSMASDLKTTLGDEFLTNIRFNLVKVTLPANVQDAVNNAQAAYAKVSEAQAQVAQAKAQADANKVRQDGYNACSTCAQIDELKALPSGITVFAPGAGTGLPLTSPAK
jgi:regulator of protease activity HflC (stomatin/prohibitin superfamily)